MFPSEAWSHDGIFGAAQVQSVLQFYHRNVIVINIHLLVEIEEWMEYKIVNLVPARSFPPACPGEVTLDDKYLVKPLQATSLDQ